MRFNKGDRIKVMKDNTVHFGTSMTNVGNSGSALFVLRYDNGEQKHFNINVCSVEVLVSGRLTEDDAKAQIGRLKQALIVAGVHPNLVEQIAQGGIH